MFDEEFRKIQEQTLVFARCVMELGVNPNSDGARIRLKYFEYIAKDNLLIPGVADRNHFDSPDPIQVNTGIKKGLAVCKVIKNRSAVVEDLSNWNPKRFPGCSALVPIKSIVAIPIWLKNELFAVVAVDCNEHFSEIYVDQRKFLNAVEALGKQLETNLEFYSHILGNIHTGGKKMLSTEEIVSCIGAANSAVDLIGNVAKRVKDLTVVGGASNSQSESVESTSVESIELAATDDGMVKISLGGVETCITSAEFSRQLWPADVKFIEALDGKIQNLNSTLLSVIPNSGQSADIVVNAKNKTEVNSICSELSQCIEQLKRFFEKIGVDMPEGYLEAIEAALEIR